MNNIYTAIILDGGEVPSFLDDSTPKGLLPLNGKCILERHFERLQKVGIKNVIVSSFKYAEEYEEFFKIKADFFGDCNIYSTKERLPLGSGGAVKNTMLNTNIEQALVLSGNTYIDIDLQKFIDFHFDNKFENSLCTTKSSNGDHKYSFNIENNALNKLVIGEPESGSFLNAGAYILDIELFNLTHLQTFSMSKEILPHLCDGSFGAFESDQKLYTIDNEEAYKNTIEELK